PLAVRPAASAAQAQQAALIRVAIRSLVEIRGASRAPASEPTAASETTVPLPTPELPPCEVTATATNIMALNAALTPRPKTASTVRSWGRRQMKVTPPVNSVREKADLRFGSGADRVRMNATQVVDSSRHAASPKNGSAGCTA